MNKEEAIEILSEMRSEYNLFGDEEEATRYHALSWAIKEMNGEPVKHGHWVGIDDEPCQVWECDVCGWIYEDDEPFYNYCPNCGAKMIPNTLNALDELEGEE